MLQAQNAALAVTGGYQTVSAASLSLAGGSGVNAKAQLSAITQSVNVSGSTTLAGGTGAGASADLFGTTTNISTGALTLVAGSGGGVGIGSVAGDGAGLVTIDNGTQVLASGPVSVTANAFTISGNGSLLGPNNLSLTVSGALNVASGSYVGAHLGAAIAAGSATINGGLFADGDLSLVSSGQVAVNGGHIDAGGVASVVAGQLNMYGGFIGSYGVGGVSVGATAVSLDNGSIIGAYAPTANVGMVISGGNLTLDHGSHILASQDVTLALSGANAQVVLNTAAGETPSTIETQVLHTTDITFFGRTSGGVVIDGAPTTTTVAGGSGFYALGNPATLGNGLNIHYITSGNNAAGNLIDQFFANLTKVGSNDKKKGDGSGEDKDDNEHNKGDVGQCT
jgi:filamentous hemagglutinin